jgi:hypothetical protein
MTGKPIFDRTRPMHRLAYAMLLLVEGADRSSLIFPISLASMIFVG